MIRPNIRFFRDIPYKKPINPRRQAIYAPTEYFATLIQTSLHTVSKSIILAMLRKTESDFSVVYPTEELMVAVGASEAHVNKCLNQLLKKDVISRKAKGEFWFNPDVVTFVGFDR